MQYVSFELSYDQFNKNTGDIYRVYNDRYQHGKLVQHGTITYSAVSKAMQDDYPEVVNHCRVVPLGDMIVTYQDKKMEQQILAADNNFLTMFDYPLLAGDKKSALEERNDVVIS